MSFLSKKVGTESKTTKVLKATKKGEYRDNEYRTVVNKFLDNQQKGGLFEWKK